MSAEDLKISRDTEVALELPSVPWDKNIFYIFNIFLYITMTLFIRLYSPWSVRFIITLFTSSLLNNNHIHYVIWFDFCSCINISFIINIFAIIHSPHSL